MVFRRGGFSAEVKKGRGTTVVRGGEVIFGPVSGKKPWFYPSILEYGNQKGKAEYGYRSCNIKCRIHSSLFTRDLTVNM